MIYKKARIGVLVVYYLDPKEEWVIKEHFRRFDACDDKQFMIYAAINRLAPGLHHYLHERDYIKIISLPVTTVRGSDEHIWYLDRLKSAALDDGCNFICTFDVDSWPIGDGFFSTIINLLEREGVELIAIQREENGDTYLPHPSFTFASADFFKRYDVSFGSPKSISKQKNFKLFLEKTKQARDSGIGVGFELWINNISWIKLIRSNIINYHFLMGGVYGDLVFHVGGSSWNKRFRGEGETWGVRVTKFMTSTPVIWRFRGLIATWLEKIRPDGVIKRNASIYQKIRQDLMVNPDLFYRKIIGKPGFSLLSEGTQTELMDAQPPNE